jgi:eukaryotic-like serine/threonine-protein kinase
MMAGMIDVPETRYARSEFGNIAYQVVGDGPIDVVFVGDWLNHVEWNWELPRHARFWPALLRSAG